MNEQTLFDLDLPRGPQATARRTDADTSHEAAAAMNASGKAQAHAEMVLAQVRFQPGSTAAEIGAATNLGHHEAARRLADLWNASKVVKGEPRICRINATRMTTWRVSNES